MNSMFLPGELLPALDDVLVGPWSGVRVRAAVSRSARVICWSSVPCEAAFEVVGGGLHLPCGVVEDGAVADGEAGGVEALEAAGFCRDEDE